MMILECRKSRNDDEKAANAFTVRQVLSLNVNKNGICALSFI